MRGGVYLLRVAAEVGAVGATGFTSVFAAAGAGVVEALGVGAVDLAASTAAFFTCSPVAFTVDFVASERVAAGLFSTIGSGFFSFILVGVVFVASAFIFAEGWPGWAGDCLFSVPAFVIDFAGSDIVFSTGLLSDDAAAGAFVCDVVIAACFLSVFL